MIISTVGTIGNCAVVDDSILPANSDRHVGIIRIKDDYSPYVLSTFLLSKYGRMQTLRESTGNVQLNLFIYKLRELQIPNFSTDFQQKIETLVKSAHAKLSESKSLYAQAEDILLCELGLKGWQPNSNGHAELVSASTQETPKQVRGDANYSIKRFSDFASSGRLDAEYYQSKYDEIENAIKALSHKTLNEIADIQDSNFNPKAKVAYKYIELANIGSSGEITGCTEDLGENLPSRARRVVHTGDVLVSSIEGSLQSCAIVPKEYDGALCSTGFYVLKAVAMNPESLLILLKSEIMQQLLKKGCSGTILTAISKDEFSHVILPILPQETQEKIAELIRRSFALRQESRRLLQSAKLAVEAEIEGAD